MSDKYKFIQRLDAAQLRDMFGIDLFKVGTMLCQLSTKAGVHDVAPAMLVITDLDEACLVTWQVPVSTHPRHGLFVAKQSTNVPLDEALNAELEHVDTSMLSDDEVTEYTDLKQMQAEDDLNDEGRARLREIEEKLKVGKPAPTPARSPARKPTKPTKPTKRT